MEEWVRNRASWKSDNACRNKNKIVPLQVETGEIMKTKNVVNTIKNYLVAIWLMYSTDVYAQDKYCSTYDDFLKGQWIEAKDGITLKTIKENKLAYTIESTNKPLRREIEAHSFALIHADSLYLNLRNLKYFGDLFVRTWSLSDGSLLFARPDIGGSGGVYVGYQGSMVPFSLNAFKSRSKLKNLVCYVLHKDKDRDELRLFKMTPDAMKELLKNNSEALNVYLSFDKKRQDDADIVIGTLKEAGIIK